MIKACQALLEDQWLMDFAATAWQADLNQFLRVRA